jgi:hypothetical protein
MACRDTVGPVRREDGRCCLGDHRSQGHSWLDAGFRQRSLAPYSSLRIREHSVAFRRWLPA